MVNSLGGDGSLGYELESMRFLWREIWNGGIARPQ